MTPNVLVVEDDETLRLVIAEALCALPAEVFRARPQSSH